MFTKSETIWRDQIDRLRESGFRSFHAGIHYHECPFADGTQAKKLWVEGWDQAKLLNEDHKDAS